MIVRVAILRPCLLGLALWHDAGRAAAADYVVEVDADRPRVAAVTARLQPAEAGLCMLRAARDTGLTHGWATFVHDLRVTSANGQPLEARYDGAGCWRVHAGGPVTAHYAVLLQHDRFPNEPGDDELAYAGDWGQFWTGRALFLEGAPADAVHVTFELPDRWHVTAPWRAAESPTSFHPADLDALLDNGFMLGQHETHVLQGVGAHVQVGLAGDGPKARAEEVVALLRSALGAFAELYQAPPTGELAVFLGQGRLLGGGVVGNTISMLVEGPVPDALLPTLDYVVTHEVFHLWNADLEYADEASFYWFIEGSAEYYTFRQMRASGVWDEATLRSQLEERDALYRKALGELSLAEAGRQKLHHYDLIYSGGLMATAALDALIQAESAGRHRLDDVLPVLLQKHRRGAGASLTLETLIAQIREVTEVDAAAYFHRYITGHGPLPPVRGSMRPEGGIDAHASGEPGGGKDSIGR
jgi:predicted metalloprotease with PDZ domain